MGKFCVSRKKKLIDTGVASVFIGIGNQVLDGFLPVKEVGYWILEGLILVNQLVSNIYRDSPDCKSSTPSLLLHGFYHFIRIIPMQSKNYTSGGFVRAGYKAVILYVME